MNGKWSWPPGQLFFSKDFGDLINAVDSAPQDIMDARAMPKPADKEGQHQVKAMPEPACPVAAQRNVYIIPEPGGEGDVPAAPEFPDTAGEIGAFKIFFQPDAEKRGAADGNIRIAGEIAVYLQGEHNRGDNIDQSGVIFRLAVDIVYGGSQQSGDNQLLEVTNRHQFQPVRGGGRVEGACFFQLGKKRVSTGDGAGKKLGEKGDKQAIISKMPFGRIFAPENIDKIA